MSRILAHANALDWEKRREQGAQPRAYAAVWVVSRMTKYLPVEHVALAALLAVMHSRAFHGYTLSPEMIGFINAYLDRVKIDRKMMTRSGIMNELAGFESAARNRVGADGWGCYRGIVEGDGQAELARRVGYPEGSARALRRLVQLTLEELQRYQDDNAIDLARWNAA